ncbi:MAG TPA: PQQ-dependent sugar dehydrogenase [Gemmatimonadales bacterium]
MRALPALIIGGILAACGPRGASSQEGPAQRSPTPGPTEGVIRSEVVAEGLEHPWALEFLPDGRMLVTERPGRLRIVTSDGRISPPLTGVPEVAARSQGGLLDVALDPKFAENRLVYLSYSEPGDGGEAGTSVARGRLGANGLEGVQVIYRQVPKVRSGGHFGSRLVFHPDGTLFVTQGDRQNQRGRVQDLANGIGKIMRIHPDGSVPRDNPFAGRAGALPEIWSYGHRNAQAATLDDDGNLWTVEHGARGGDELNQPGKGRNYGWPVITYGVDYSGMRIGEGNAKEGMEQPVYYWDPVIAPSGMTFYTGDAFPGWKGNLLIGSLGTGSLVRLVLDGGRVTTEERYRVDGGARVRDVRQGPDGFVYVVTDADNGKVVRIVPASVRSR